MTGFRGRTITKDNRLIVFISFYPAIDVQVHRLEKPIGFLVVLEFDSVIIIFMKQQFYLLADELHRPFIKALVKDDSSVIIDLAPNGFPEMVLEIIRSGPDTFNTISKSF